METKAASRAHFSWADEVEKEEEEEARAKQQHRQQESAPKPNPFGDARPREIVLEERGVDWRNLENELQTSNFRTEKKIESMSIPQANDLEQCSRQVSPNFRNPQLPSSVFLGQQQKHVPPLVPPFQYPPKNVLYAVEQTQSIRNHERFQQRRSPLSKQEIYIRENMARGFNENQSALYYSKTEDVTTPSFCRRDKENIERFQQHRSPLSKQEIYIRENMARGFSENQSTLYSNTVDVRTPSFSRRDKENIKFAYGGNHVGRMAFDKTMDQFLPYEKMVAFDKTMDQFLPYEKKVVCFSQEDIHGRCAQSARRGGYQKNLGGEDVHNERCAQSSRRGGVYQKNLGGELVEIHGRCAQSARRGGRYQKNLGGELVEIHRSCVQSARRGGQKNLGGELAERQSCLLSGGPKPSMEGPSSSAERSAVRKGRKGKNARGKLEKSIRFDGGEPVEHWSHWSGGSSETEGRRWSSIGAEFRENRVSENPRNKRMASEIKYGTRRRSRLI